MADYSAALEAFDAAVCEALSVSQASSGRLLAAHIGVATHIFARICGHAVAIVRAVPKSRWTASEFEFWDCSSIAGHCRTLIEGQLLLHYVIKEPESDDEWDARVNVMDLNDCSRRVKILEGVVSPEELAKLSAQAEEIRDRLRSNVWFSQLGKKAQARLLSGDRLTISSRDDQLAAIGWDRKHFYLMWNLLSQYTHVLPLSFYRLEPSGRGTGVDNEFDRGYTAMMLEQSCKALVDCTNRIVKAFPDVSPVRNGVNSKFSNGPLSNSP